MACQRCPRLRQELQRTRDNVLLIEGLLEDARRRERTQDTLDRLAMLHKHCRTNYNDMANINFALNHCQNIPRCPGEWNHVPNWNRKLRTVTRVTEPPPTQRCYLQMTCGRSLCAWPSLPTSQKEEEDTHPGDILPMEHVIYPEKTMSSSRSPWPAA